MAALRHAFKEWAVICRALAAGRQALILRKGGIAEDAGEFRVEHTRFWLYPTFVHQQGAGIVREAERFLLDSEADRPPAGIVRLTHFAEVDGIYHVHDIASALKLAEMHLWSRDTVQARFAYRTPGLYVLPVRVWKASEICELPETPAYAGCKTWVELERDLPTDGATPVLTNRQFDEVRRRLVAILQPTGIA